MSFFKNILYNLPEVEGPTERRLPFNEKLKWTGIILFLFFILGLIPLYGLGSNALQQFHFVATIFGAEFGSIISLGIGPIVTGSIVLQLLSGSGLLSLDTKTPEGKRTYQGIQKLTAMGFVILEAIIYVASGGLAPAPGVGATILIFQLFLGGILIIFMDEVVSKWGFGSGISLFIAAGVSKSLVIRLISPLSSSGGLYWQTGEPPAGALLSIFYSLPIGNLQDVMINLLAIIATILIFAIAVYAQAMKIEIPLSLGRIRGHGIRWPLSFIYTSNIPVILVAAFLASVQLWARLLQNWGKPILGTFTGNIPTSGIVQWLTAPNIVGNIITGTFQAADIAHSIVYMLVFMAGSVMFSMFWVKTAGMDAQAQAQNMMNSGLQIPGFRRDVRVLEQLLNRYIPALTVMGAITVGFLAATADLLGALTSGTGLLLTVMIIYKLYEEIAQQHTMDMNPLMRKFME